jgi:hypothetical protein
MGGFSYTYNEQVKQPSIIIGSQIKTKSHQSPERHIPFQIQDGLNSLPLQPTNPRTLHHHHHDRQLQKKNKSITTTTTTTKQKQFPKPRDLELTHSYAPW